jgi:hypothetical protein
MKERRMNIRSSRCAAIALSATLLLAGAYAHAQSSTPLFEPLFQGRWLINSGNVEVQGIDGQVGFDSAFHYLPLQPDDNFFTLYDITDVLTLDVTAPDGTAAVHAASTVSHTSFIGPDSMRFEGSVDAQTTSTGTPGPSTNVQIGAGGLMANFMGFAFRTTSAMQVALTLDASLAPDASQDPVHGVFEFVLNSDFGPVFSASTRNPEGLPAGTVIFEIPAGQYSFEAALSASALLNEHILGTGSAELHLLAIPEAETWALLVVGLPAVGALALRGRRRLGGAV